MAVITTDPGSFSKRGQIWTALLDRWSDSPLFGWGPKVFQDPAVTAELGGQFSHGHNVMVQLLVVGGLMAVVPFALLCFVAWRRSVALAADGHPAALLFLVAFMHVSWLEASHLSTTLTGYLAWLPLLAIALAGPASPPARSGRPPAPIDSAGSANGLGGRSRAGRAARVPALAPAHLAAPTPAGG